MFMSSFSIEHHGSDSIEVCGYLLYCGVISCIVL